LTARNLKKQAAAVAGDQSHRNQKSDAAKRCERQGEHES
jgi:hypothetical protein